jgi:transcription elongation factor Elf1
MPGSQNNLICAICGQSFQTEEERIAHERNAHGMNRPGPSVEQVNTSEVAEKKAS